MDSAKAKGWRWATNTMKVFGIAAAVRLFFAFKSNQFKGLVEAAMIILLGVVIASIAFGLGWMSAKKPTLAAPGGTDRATPAASPRVPSKKSYQWVADLLLAGVVVAVGVGWITNRMPSGSRANAGQHPVPAVPDLATATAKRLNQELPETTSSDTRLDSVTADPGRAVIYDFTFVRWPEMRPMDQQTSERFRALVVASTCGGEDEYLLEHGISLRNRYRRLDGLTIADVTVAPGDCRRTQR